MLKVFFFSVEVEREVSVSQVIFEKKTKFKKHIANLKGENTIVINRGLPSGKKPMFYFPKSLLALCPRPRAYTVQYHCFKYPCIIPSTIVIF